MPSLFSFPRPVQEPWGMLLGAECRCTWSVKWSCSYRLFNSCDAKQWCAAIAHVAYQWGGKEWLPMVALVGGVGWWGRASEVRDRERSLSLLNLFLNLFPSDKLTNQEGGSSWWSSCIKLKNFFTTGRFVFYFTSNLPRMECSKFGPGKKTCFRCFVFFAMARPQRSQERAYSKSISE